MRRYLLGGFLMIEINGEQISEHWHMSGAFALTFNSASHGTDKNV